MWRHSSAICPDAVQMNDHWQKFALPESNRNTTPPSTRKRADLLRQFFNFWNNAGNLAKIIKRRFRDKLRTHNTPLVVLFKHITVFALEVARLRNKSIIHSITPLSFYYCHLWQITAAGIEPTQAKNKDTRHGKNGGYTDICYFTYNKNLLELLHRLSFYHLRGDILHRIRHQTTTKQAIPQA